jgi:hypothetical protein
MSISRATERSVLTGEQFDLVASTHHPAIYDLDAKALRDLQRKLRAERDKVRAHVRQLEREGRGKSEPRGKAYPGPGDQPSKRKQVMSNALKRVNRELERIRMLEARTAHVEAAWRALALHRGAKFERVTMASRTPNEGMQPQPSMLRRKIVSGSRIGSVSQAVKVAQAIKDDRGA